MGRMQGRSAERRELPSDDAAVKHREELLDEALEGTFPASDPFSLNVVATPGTRTNSVDQDDAIQSQLEHWWAKKAPKENPDGA